MKVDIKFIARKAGVSIATVSRVLNQSKPVSPALSAKVMVAVEQYEYHPNRIAQGFSLNRSHLIGVVVPTISGMYHARLLESIELFSERAGYGVLVSNVGRDASFQGEKRCFQILRERGADGIILLHENAPTEMQELCRIFQGPLVLASVNVPECELPWVGIDEERASFDAATHLLALGHRQIGAILGGGYSLSTLRLNGYRRALGQQYNPEHIAFSECSIESGARAAELLLRRQPELTALFCVSDEIAIGAMRRLQQSGFQIPQDISIVGFDDIDIDTIVSPQLSTVCQPVREIGSEAAKLLISVIEGRSGLPSRVCLQHSLTIRESSAAPSPFGQVKRRISQ